MHMCVCVQEVGSKCWKYEFEWLKLGLGAENVVFTLKSRCKCRNVLN